VERLFTDYEATSHEVLSEHVKIAALRRLLPPEIKVHVNMLVKDTTTYADVKATVTEYEVAERRYTPLKEASVYDHTSGAVPMDVDQVQASKGGKAKGKSGSKGKSSKGDKPSVCKHCGKAHKGECWYKDGKSNASGKGKASGQKGKGSSTGDTQGAKTKCQICGKTNHTADKCYQRYKEGDAKGKVNHAGHCTGDRSDGDGSPTARSGYVARDRVEGDINWGEILHRRRSSHGADRLWQ
jgi:hypothetical protein